MSEAPLLSRPRNPETESIEVRVKLHPAFVAALDTEAGNYGIDRTAYVRRCLQRELIEVQRRAIRHAQAQTGNPPLADLVDDSDFGGL